MLNRGKMVCTCVPPPEGLLSGFFIGGVMVLPLVSRERTISQKSIVIKHGVFVTIDLHQF